MTRCAHAGSPSDWAGQAWEVVHEAYVAAVAMTRLGATAKRVDAAQRDIIEAHPDLGACLHGAGHAIGTEVHEPPFLVAVARTSRCAKGMIFTVEPGIYHSEHGGIRLEDDVLVGPDGPVLLTRSPAAATGDRLAAGALALVHPAHLLAAAARRHRAPAAAAARVQEDPAAVAPRAAVQAGDAGGVGEQGDRVGGDREAHAARLVLAPVEAEAAVLARTSVPGGDRLRVGEAQPRERELIRLLPARERGEDVVQRGPQAARELELVRAAGLARDARAACPSGPASPPRAARRWR